MTDYNYDFPDKSYAGLVNFFEHNQAGQQFTTFMAESFSSVNQAMRHTTMEDGSAVVHLLTGDTLTIQDVPRRRWSNIVHSVAGYFGLT